jgi:hypothetical protein
LIQLTKSEYLQKYLLVNVQKGDLEVLPKALSQLEYLAERLGMTVHFQSALDKTFGNAILTKPNLQNVVKEHIVWNSVERRSVVGGTVEGTVVSSVFLQLKDMIWAFTVHI